ncbi:MAG TPA: 8-oxo-dGTP diphosphatase [Patescibacteria group bacterium]
MKLVEYEQSLEAPLRQATIVFLLKGDEILLAMKKRGFGVNKWNGVGGKPNPGEKIEQTAIRESKEEIDVIPLEPKKVAVLSFYSSHDKGEHQQVHVFTATKWQGEPVESEEMKPQWFKVKDIPYNKMWPDDKFWLPKVLSGSLVKASFLFGKNEKIKDYYVNNVNSLE